MSLLLFFGGGGGGSTIALPVDLQVDLALGGTYRAWLQDRGTCVRHWFLGDVSTLQARDEVTEDASGDGVYAGGPVKARGMLPEYGLATTFDGVDDEVAISSGLSGTGGTFTVSALVRPATAGMGTVRCVMRTGPAGAFYLGINTANQVVFGVFGGDKVTSSLTLVAGQAYLVIGSYDGSAGTLHVATLGTGVVMTGAVSFFPAAFFAPQYFPGADGAPVTATVGPGTIVSTGPTAFSFAAPHGSGLIGAA